MAGTSGDHEWGPSADPRRGSPQVPDPARDPQPPYDAHQAGSSAGWPYDPQPTGWSVDRPPHPDAEPSEPMARGRAEMPYSGEVDPGSLGDLPRPTPTVYTSGGATGQSAVPHPPDGPAPGGWASRNVHDAYAWGPQTPAGHGDDRWGSPDPVASAPGIPDGSGDDGPWVLHVDRPGAPGNPAGEPLYGESGGVPPYRDAGGVPPASPSFGTPYAAGPDSLPSEPPPHPHDPWFHGPAPHGDADPRFHGPGPDGVDPAEAGGEPVDPGPRPGRSRHRSSRRRRQLPLWQEVPLLLIAAFLIAVLIRTFLLQAFYIPSGSMEHTLDIGDKVLVNKMVYDVRDPARGEIVVFRGTDRWAPEHSTPPTSAIGKVGRSLGDLVGLSQPGEKDFIKRVIGLPGDIVACCDAQGRVTVNGHPLDEPYIFENSPDDVPPSVTECRSREFEPVTVPAGHVFVMGDHRLVSQDSRCQGPVPIENIIGRAFLVVWPAKRWATLDVPDGFRDVPKPYAYPDHRIPYQPAGGVVLPIALPLVISAARWRRAGGRRPRRLTA